MEFQVADLFEAVSDQIPEREALVLGKKRLTYAQLDKRSNKAAHMLKKIGIGKGDHIGIYAYRRSALQRFVSLTPSYLEQREKLEQLRALEDGMRIEVAFVDSVPLGVDTPADLEKVRQIVDNQTKT